VTRLHFDDSAAAGIDWPRFAWASLGLHGLVLVAVAFYEWHTPTPLSPEMLTRMQASVQRAHRVQMQRKLEALEQMQRELAHEGEGDAKTREQTPEQIAEKHAAQDASLSQDPKLMLERAKAIALRVDEHDRQLRAQALASKTGLPLAKALEQVKQADAAQAASAPRPSGDPSRQINDLTAHVRQTLAGERQRAAQAGDQDRQDGTGGRGGQTVRSVGHGNADAFAKGRQQAGDAGGASRAGVYTPGAWGSPLLDDFSFFDQRDYGPMLPTHAVDTAHLALGTGRTIGAGGVFANRVFVDSWYLIGPFGGYGARSHDVVFEPERGVDLDAVYVGKNGIPLEWRYVPGNAYPIVPPQRAENAVFYAYTEIRVDEDMNVWFNVGSDDDSKVWVNDELVWSSNSGDKPWYRKPFYALHDEMRQYNLVEGRVRVHLHSGANPVLFKLYNGIDLMFLSVVLTP